MHSKPAKSDRPTVFTLQWSQTLCKTPLKWGSQTLGYSGAVKQDQAEWRRTAQAASRRRPARPRCHTRPVHNPNVESVPNLETTATNTHAHTHALPRESSSKLPSTKRISKAGRPMPRPTRRRGISKTLSKSGIRRPEGTAQPATNHLLYSYAVQPAAGQPPASKGGPAWQ
jgi:hypothetical protein